jgi:hypothetical protein
MLFVRTRSRRESQEKKREEAYKHAGRVDWQVALLYELLVISSQLSGSCGSGEKNLRGAGAAAGTAATVGAAGGAPLAGGGAAGGDPSIVALPGRAVGERSDEGSAEGAEGNEGAKTGRTAIYFSSSSSLSLESCGKL